MSNRTLKTRVTGAKSLTLIKNTLLTIFSILITLMVVEIILRLFLGHILFSGSSVRSLYYSSPNAETTQNGSVHYAPNMPIRSIAVYYNQIEYDTKHHSNNLGFLSDLDYHKEDKKGVIFLGDSFTAGDGSASPWLPILDKKYPDINLYSLGVSGTGQVNFYSIFENYQDDLNYDTVVIMSISDDLTRPMWHPVEKDRWLVFCLDEPMDKECKNGKKIAHLIDYAIDKKTLLLPEELYLVKAYRVLKSKFEAYIKSKAPQLAIIKSSSVPEKSKIEESKVVKKSPEKPEINLEYIAKIKLLADQKGKKVIFVHLPEKNETILKRYRYDVGQKIKDMGIEYHPILQKYQFDISMFHVHDGHPNDKGYAYISSIIEDILKLKDPAL